ncbi:putative nuclease HARBI1 [Dendropsophus ebraccatus]
MEEQQSKRPRFWSKKWLQQREEFSHMPLLCELKERNPDDYRNYLRMSSDTFSKLLDRVRPLIEKHDTVMRPAIPAEQRLAATLRFMATGRSLQDLKFTTAISQPMLSRIVPETCTAIVTSLQAEYFKFPSSEQEWLAVADEFKELWQFPNCGGALDGKHIRITQPTNSGSYFYNYKGFFSIVLMALVNAKYEFLMVDVGTNGRMSDGGVLERTEFSKRLRQSALHLPGNDKTVSNLNFVFVADDAFPLHPNLLKPYPSRNLTMEKKIFNYRLSRARRVVENTFGIMANRFRIFHTAINLKPENIDKVVMACCVLHNFLRRHESQTYLSSSREESGSGQIDAVDQFTSLQPTSFHRHSHDAITARDLYKNYFNGEGSVPWQEGYL